ncbi:MULTISPECIES: ArsR/SmtB family transcription factor [Halorussus]|uniref:ArsR/SmtB family transcription factor n=1 Tax=Halorussus TaxID=1070314 RepID=UPI00209E35CB|nr:helix-turn-helix domain-containing protein [Halorussus vallis]USZ75280.1 helix-turn-helix domain-containing protein [Halorussus vallis]
MAEELDASDLSDVLGQAQVLRILELASGRPMSAEELAERCDVSLSTVYRRVKVLEEYDLLDDRTQVDADGQHFTVYRTSLNRLCLRVDDGELRVTVSRTADTVDRFRRFWKALRARRGRRG